MTRGRRYNLSVARAIQPRRAFTLVEVVAALAILGGVIAGLLVIRANAAAGHAAAAQMLKTSRICARVAAELRVGSRLEGTETIEGCKCTVTRLAPPVPTMPRLYGYEIRVAPESAADAASTTITLWLPRKDAQ